MCPSTPALSEVLHLRASAHLRGQGACARAIDEIAARAGTCRRMVQNAILQAAALGLLTVQERRREGLIEPLAGAAPSPPVLDLHPAQVRARLVAARDAL
jgi:hypothetical protein